MNILIIAPDYPDKVRSVYTFVKQVVDQFAIQGNRCCVIAPYSISKNHNTYKFKEVQKTEGGEDVVVLRPNHLSLSTFTIFGFTPSDYWRNKAINKALRKLPFVPDVIYAHFWRSGREIFKYAKDNGIPLFIASGESQIPKEDISPYFKEFYDYVSGVICVSSKNKKESIDNGMVTEDRCIVAPNSVNSKFFHKIEKKDCRKRLNLPDNVFIVAFCGAFIHRKGVKVLSDAIDSLDGEPVYSMFMGRPLEELPTCNNILYQGPVSHSELKYYLNAADIFVLPTLREGCCNAIIEAMACGLPIVSSNRSFNWDVLNKKNSLLVNPNSVEETAQAIRHLRDNLSLREQLARKAMASVRELTIDKRAKIILDFITKRIHSKNDK